MEEENPSVIILTLDNKDGSDIVKGILDVSVLPSPNFDKDGISSWFWKMENKYYNADIQITTVQSPDNLLNWIQGCGEALVIYCDSAQDTALENLNSLLESIGGFEPEVQLLVCDSCSSDDSTNELSRLKAQQWCIRNGWELIELKKVKDEDDNEDSDCEDDFPESWGFQRIRQALHAHTWSNLKMKDKGSNFSAVMQSVVSMDGRNTDKSQSSDDVMYSRLGDLNLDGENGEPDLSHNRLQCDEDSQVTESTMNSAALEDYLELGESDFEKLFANFEHMKKTAASLPPEHRRDYAEKVAISFWKAVGGPDDELDGLDSD